jgi:hypothetical protein
MGVVVVFCFLPFPVFSTGWFDPQGAATHSVISRLGVTSSYEVVALLALSLTLGISRCDLLVGSGRTGLRACSYPNRYGSALLA